MSYLVADVELQNRTRQVTTLPKVVHVTSVHPPFDTRIFHRECKTLVAAGYDVVLVAPHARDETIQGIRIRALPQPIGRLQRMLTTTRQAFQAAMGEGAALYHFHDPELIPLAYVLRRRGLPVIYDMHENVAGALAAKHWVFPPLRPFVQLVYRVIERALLPAFSVIFAETSYADLYPWLKRTITVLNLPNWDDLAEITVPKQAVFTCGYMGGVSAPRGCGVTLQALSILSDLGHSMAFECVGPYIEAQKRTFDAQVREAGLQQVRFHGRLSQADGWALMAACHVGLAVLQPSPNYVGSYPTKMFEYMALGLPVIVSDFPLYRSVVDRAQCGICVEPTDPRALAEALLFVAAHPDEATTMGENGRRFVEREMNWQTEAAKLLDFYARTIGQLAPPP